MQKGGIFQREKRHDLANVAKLDVKLARPRLPGALRCVLGFHCLTIAPRHIFGRDMRRQPHAPRAPATAAAAAKGRAVRLGKCVGQLRERTVAERQLAHEAIGLVRRGLRSHLGRLGLDPEPGEVRSGMSSVPWWGCPPAIQMRKQGRQCRLGTITPAGHCKERRRMSDLRGPVNSLIFHVRGRHRQRVFTVML